MILYDLFKMADVDKIVAIYEKQREEDEFDCLDEKEKLEPAEERKLYQYFIDKMLEKTPEKNKDESVLLGRIIMNNAFFNKEIQFSTDVTCYKKSELREKKEEIKKVANMKPTYEMGVQEIRDFLEMSKTENPTDWIIPSGYAYEFTEWETVLGWEVDEENVNKIGINEFLAYVIEEMTFNGFLEESQEERRSELQDSIDEYEELMQLPEEEQEKHFVSLDELEKEFGLKGKDNETEEEKTVKKIEKEESDVRFVYEAMYNAQAGAKAMLFILEGN